MFNIVILVHLPSRSFTAHSDLSDQESPDQSIFSFGPIQSHPPLGNTPTPNLPPAPTPNPDPPPIQSPTPPTLNPFLPSILDPTLPDPKADVWTDDDDNEVLVVLARSRYGPGEKRNEVDAS